MANPASVVAPLLAAALACALLALHVSRQRQVSGATALAALMGAVAWWALAYAAEIASVDAAEQLLWARLTYAGIVAIPTLYLLFCVGYGQPAVRWGWPWLLLLVEPLLVFSLVWLEPGLGVLWRDVTPGLGLSTTKAPGFWIHAAYSYVVLGVATAVLLRRLRRAAQIYRRQLVVVTLACSAPWLANAAYLAGLSPLRGLDPTPFAFTITGLGLTWGLMRHRLLSLAPLAHEAVMENLDDGILVIDRGDRVVDVNPAAQRIFDRDRGQLVGLTLDEATLLPCREIGHHAPGSEVMLPVGGEPRHFEVRCVPVRDRRQRLSGQLYVLHDISDSRRRQAEREALQRIRDRLWEMQKADDIEKVLKTVHSTLACLPIPFDYVGINLVSDQADAAGFVPLTLDRKGGQVTAGNVRVGEPLATIWRTRKTLYRPDLETDDAYGERQAALRIFGHHSGIRSVVDVPFSHGTLALSSLQPHAFQKADLAFLERLAEVLTEAYRRREDLLERERHLAELEAEVETRRRAEEALRQAKEEAEMANRAKGDFIANISHELRTPINAILGMTELVLASDLNPMQHSYLDTASKSTRQLLDLLNGLLDFARLERQAVELEAVPFSLRQCLASAMQGLAPAAHGKGLDLSFRVPAYVTDSLVGDPARLRQILVNLVGNAVKFTSAGQVNVVVGVVGAWGEAIQLRFEVHDTGPGIETERQEAIFEAFAQADASTSRTHGGTGLGLTISRDLVHLMAGQIWVSSQPGKGSTFYFTARFGLSPSAVAQAPDLPQALRCLVVEPHAESRLAVGELLRLWQIAHTGVDSPVAAVRACRETRFDILLVGATAADATQDGLEFLRQEAGEAGLIVMTTFDGVDAWTRADRPPAAVLVKPVSPEQLRPALEDAATPTAPRTGAVAEAAGPPAVVPLRVLIVDDTPANRTYAAAVLRRRGHEVALARDGSHGLEILVAQGPFDIILMDLHMPGMSGADTAVEIHRRLGDAAPPIIAVSADTRHVGPEGCAALGMDGHLSKPFLPQDLVRAVEQTGVRATDVRDMGHAEDTGPSAPETDPDHGRLTRAQVLASVEDDVDLLQDLVSTIEQDLPERLRQARKAADRHDAATLEEAAHALANLVGLLGPNRALEAARRVEATARKGDLNGLAPQLETLDQEVKVLLQDLNRIISASPPEAS